ncbi:YqcC family protein [Pseudoalteromonas sp. SMS1]|uniref:YqcC family protein n=1 Tax=Pseudoalteromonas sp. SMS1 TaxID=2908894 RepID=UPI001F4072C3|nr:YqcC family protein [Pseudoalteromonas sp. SMS1]MCF2860429.1 YqcC family protein [Pseudoalteromonas sp. SMS1]
MNQQVLQHLAELADQLKQAKLWQSEPIDMTALASTQPFCCDTLRFEQWLQFVFIPKIQQMINEEQPLPTSIAITPMAEIAFAGHVQQHALISILKQIDTVISQGGTSSC